MGDREKRILGGLALAALVATGAGAAGLGPLAEVMGAAGTAGEGAAGAAAAEAAGTAAVEGAGTGLSEAQLLALESEGMSAGAGGSLGGATQAQPAAGALGEGGGALGQGQMTPKELLMKGDAGKAPFSFDKLLAKTGDKATDAAIMTAIGQAAQPEITTKHYAQMPFAGYQPQQMRGMQMTPPELQLRRLGFS